MTKLSSSHTLSLGCSLSFISFTFINFHSPSSVSTHYIDFYLFSSTFMVIGRRGHRVFMFICILTYIGKLTKVKIYQIELFRTYLWFNIHLQCHKTRVGPTNNSCIQVVKYVLYICLKNGPSVNKFLI